MDPRLWIEVALFILSSLGGLGPACGPLDLHARAADAASAPESAGPCDIVTR